jgi:hypothetical protein
MSSVYVYALTGAPLPSATFASRELQSIDCGGVYAVAESMGERPPASEEMLRRQHDVIVRIASRVDAVLPARFGSFLEVEELRTLLEARRDVIREALDLVRGRQQMTVRIMTDPAMPGVAPAAAPGAATGTAYLQQRRAAVSPAAVPGVEIVQHSVRDLVASERLERTPAGATVYHLIAAGADAAYRERIQGITVDGTALNARVTGPWPPFAFAPELIG